MAGSSAPGRPVGRAIRWAPAPALSQEAPARRPARPGRLAWYVACCRPVDALSSCASLPLSLSLPLCFFPSLFVSIPFVSPPYPPHPSLMRHPTTTNDAGWCRRPQWRCQRARVPQILRTLPQGPPPQGRGPVAGHERPLPLLELLSARPLQSVRLCFFDRHCSCRRCKRRIARLASARLAFVHPLPPLLSHLYLDFKRLAHEDAKAGARYGLMTLFRFYGYGLEKTFRKQIFEDFQLAAIEDCRNGTRRRGAGLFRRLL